MKFQSVMELLLMHPVYTGSRVILCRGSIARIPGVRKCFPDPDLGKNWVFDAKITSCPIFI